jgi:DNA primase
MYLLGKASRMYAASLRVLGAGPGTPWAYLRLRGFTDETIQGYRLGYCPGRRRNVLLETIRQTGFPVEAARAMRLLDAAHGDREFLRGRIVLPCLDADGRVVHLAGRKWAKFLHPRAPKYLYLYGLPKPLYGLAQIKPGSDPLLFTESLPDWLTLRQWGFDAVCNLGTGLTPAHAQMLRQTGRPLVYVPQSDESGVGLEAVTAWRKMVGKGAVLALPGGVKDVNDLAVAGRRSDLLASLADVTASGA